MEQNILAKQSKVLSTINLGQLLESTKAITMSGEKLHAFISENFNNQVFNNVTNMLSVASHCLASKDSAMIDMGNSIVESIKGSIDARLFYCLETVQASSNNQFSQLSKQLSEKLQDIIAMESVDEQLSAIRSGNLSTFRTVTPLVDFVFEMAKVDVADQVTETIHHKAYHPIVFVEEGANSDIFLRLGNKVFNIKGNEVLETVSVSPKFTYLSSIVEALRFDHIKDCFVLETANLGSFVINEQGVFRNEENVVMENFNNSSFKPSGTDLHLEIIISGAPFTKRILLPEISESAIVAIETTKMAAL
jgi:hypothetical protein